MSEETQLDESLQVQEFRAALDVAMEETRRLHLEPMAETDTVQQDIARQLGMNAIVEQAIQDTKPPEPPKKKCTIEQVLPSSVISLIEAMPHNDTVRALILAHLKMECPKEADTFNKIRDWIEFNIEAPEAPDNKWKPISPLSGPRPPRAVISIAIEGSENEVGTCRYSVRRSGTGNYEISETVLMDIASECDSLDGVIESIRDWMNDDGASDNIDMETDHDTMDYDHHEASDSNGFEWNFARIRDLRELIHDTIARISPDEIARLSSDE